MRYLALTKVVGEKPTTWVDAGDGYIQTTLEESTCERAWVEADSQLYGYEFDYISITALEGTYARNS